MAARSGGVPSISLGRSLHSGTQRSPRTGRPSLRDLPPGGAMTPPTAATAWLTASAAASVDAYDSGRNSVETGTPAELHVTAQPSADALIATSGGTTTPPGDKLEQSTGMTTPERLPALFQRPKTAAPNASVQTSSIGSLQSQGLGGAHSWADFQSNSPLSSAMLGLSASTLERPMHLSSPRHIIAEARRHNHHRVKRDAVRRKKQHQVQRERGWNNRNPVGSGEVPR